MTIRDALAPPGARAGTEGEAAALRAHILHLVGRYAALAHAPPGFAAGSGAVPVSGKVYGAPELRALVDSALDFWLTTGRFNDAFETALARIVGARWALTCNSGSSANLLAVSALTSPLFGDAALRPGDEVITCAAGFPTTVNPILQNNLVPVFVDVHIPTYNIRADLIEAAITPRTRAIVLAHALGNPFDLDTVTSLAARHNLLLVEDCCDALGATYGGRPVGSFGDAATLSFYPAHHITTGEGGAVMVNRGLMKRAVESIRDWGRDCWCAPGADDTCKQRFNWQLGELPHGYDHKYAYSHLGYNLKMTDMQASVGLAQLDRLDGFIAARRRNFALLRDGLADLADMLILPEPTFGANPSWFGFPLTLRADAPFSREALVAELNRHRIGTRNLFGGNLVRQPYMRGRAFRVAGDLSASDTVMRRTFWIGVYPGLDAPQLGFVVDRIRAFCRATRG
jgi:CDP-6-deoxy-D-xylo-4-hexulose-3-dehydrase